MVKLVGTGGNQVPTNNMLGNMAFQNKEGVSADLLSLAAGTASAPSLIPSGDTNTGMWFPAADTVAISTNGGERLRVDNSGYVGIGTASPLTFLHVRGGAGGINSILDSNSSSDTRIEFRNNATRAGYVYWDTSEVRYFADTSRFSTFYTNASERMRITSAGNVGIGTTTPSTKLDVVGGANVSTELDYNYTAASLPSAAPALDLNFVMSESVDQRITFTRATTATFVGSNGLIQTAAANVPRIEYDPVTLECRGLLIEEQRTNLLLRSADFDLSPWLLDNVTVTANSTVAPDGTSTADAIIENTATSTHSINTTATVALTPYTYSAYVKPNGRSWVRLFVFQSGIASNSVWFNVSTGVVGFASAGASNVSIRAAGNGWYRCSITFTPASAATASFYIALADADGAGSYTGDGTSGLFVWGAQAEAGSFATSYIPTTTVAVQRNADVASIATSVFPYNATEGTLVANLNTAIPAATVVRRIAILSQGASASNSNQIYWYNSNIGGRTDAGGVTQADTLTAYTSGTNSKASYAFKANDFQFCKDGVLSSPDTSGSFPTNIDTMYIGSINGSGVINGWIRQIIYYSARLTNAQLQALTT